MSANSFKPVRMGVADFARGLREPGCRPEVTLEQAIRSRDLAIAATEGAVGR
jgi:hypothetical protein